MTRKFLAMLLAMAMLLSMVIVPASADEQPESLPEQAQEVAAEEGEALPEEQPEALPKEEPLEESVQMPLLDENYLQDKTVTLTMTPRETEVTLDSGEAYVAYDLYLQTSDTTPIQACAFNLAADADMELAAVAGDTTQEFAYSCEADALSRVDLAANHDSFGHPYNLIAYEPSSGYFALAGYDMGGSGIANSQTKVMTIVAKFTAPGSYTLDAVNCIAGNGQTVDAITQKFGTFAVDTQPVTVKKAATTVNVTAAASKTAVNVNDTFTVTLSNKAMSVNSFTAGLSFDTNALQVTDIAAKSGYSALCANAAHVQPQMSTVAEANETGTVGFGMVAGSGQQQGSGAVGVVVGAVGVGTVASSDRSYAAEDIVTVTFKALKAGTTAVTPYESSAGLSGFTGSGAEVSITVAEAAHTHTMEAHPAVAPTADQPGNTAYWYCTECGKYFSDSQGLNEIEKDSWVISAVDENTLVLSVVPQQETICPNAEDKTVKFDVIIDQNPGIVALKLKFLYDSDKMTLTKITNNSDAFEGTWSGTVAKAVRGWLGSEDNTATGTFVTLTFSVKGDLSLDEMMAVQATCEEGNCSNYREEEVAVISSEGSVTVAHKFDQENTAEKYLAAAATCEGKAQYYLSCACGTACEQKFEYGNALGHDWNEGTVTTKADCTHEGVMTFECERCHTVRDEVIAAAGHKFNPALVYPATPSASGYTVYRCSVCNETENRDIKQYDANGMLLTLTYERSKTTKAYRETEVTADVTLENNPGMIAMKLNIVYDHTKLTLREIQTEGLVGTWTPNVSKDTVTWLGNEDSQFNGKIMTLVFDVTSDAELGETEVSLTYNFGDVANYAEDVLYFSEQSAKVNVVERIAGDINYDFKVNMLDVVRLLKFVSEEEVYVVPGSTNVNGSGGTNMLDVVRLLKYVSEEEVTIQ